MRILKLEATSDNVTLLLENGVQVSVTTHSDHLHLHFSGVKDHVTASAFHNHSPEELTPQLANYLDVGFTPSRER